jgi:diacylglycerol kinase (ATP)
VRPLLEAAWPDLEWTESHSHHHVTELAAEAVQSGYERVIVAGGDGTVHFAANSVAGTPTALGVLPVGSGNDVAASVGLPKDVWTAAAMLTENYIHYVDVGQVGSRLYCCVLGVGMDTPALQVINASWMRRGKFLYTWAALRTLCSYQPQPLAISGAGTPFEGEVFFAAVTNTRTYAGGFPITPAAAVHDGLLDLCIIPRMGRLRALATFARLMSGMHVQMPGIVSSQGACIQLASDRPLPITLDGELTTLTTPAEVRVLPGALRLLGAPHGKKVKG